MGEAAGPTFGQSESLFSDCSLGVSGVSKWMKGIIGRHVHSCSRGEWCPQWTILQMSRFCLSDVSNLRLSFFFSVSIIGSPSAPVELERIQMSFIKFLFT